MKVRVSIPALFAAAALGAVAVAPAASAAPVDKATFDAQFDAAATAFLAQPKGAATATKFSVTKDGMPFMEVSVVENANGSSLTTGKVFGMTLTERCLTATKCWAQDPKTKKWRPSKPHEAAALTQEDLTAQNLSEGLDAAATFDVDGSTFTIVDPQKGSVTVTFSGSTLSLSSTQTDPDSGAQVAGSATMNIAAEAVPVVKPPKKAIAKGPSTSSVSLTAN